MNVKFCFLLFVCIEIVVRGNEATLEGPDIECSLLGLNILVTGPGYISSPGFQNGSYPPSTKCYWALSAPDDKWVELDFVSLDLERDLNCAADYVILSSSETDVRVCGSQKPPRFLALGSQNVEVGFTSNRNVQLKGFQLRYRLLDEICPATSFTCKNFRCVSKGKVCDSIDDCQDGSDEQECGRPTIPPLVCGTPEISPELGNDFRIVGGREAVPGSWPWQISLQHMDVYPSGHFCGGTLLNNFWILTAAHCLKDVISNPRVKLGLHNTFEKLDGEIVRYVEEIYIHKDYNNEGINDIALAKLNAEVKYSATVSPICLPVKEDQLPEGNYVHITGWGETKTKNYGGELKQVMVPVANYDGCVKAFSSFRKVGKQCFCTGYTDQVHTSCVGDSGGPVVALKNGKWIVSGAVSWGSGTCSHLIGPAINTQVTDYVEWIKSIMYNDTN